MSTLVDIPARRPLAFALVMWHQHCCQCDAARSQLWIATWVCFTKQQQLNILPYLCCFWSYTVHRKVTRNATLHVRRLKECEHPWARARILLVISVNIVYRSLVTAGGRAIVAQHHRQCAVKRRGQKETRAWRWARTAGRVVFVYRAPLRYVFTATAANGDELRAAMLRSC